MDSKKQRVVLFPFMAQGHITPFLLLGELILKRNPNCTISLISTPLNILSLHNTLPPNSKINLRSLPFQPSSHNLPPDAENSSTIPFNLVIDFFHASQTLQPAFDKLIFDMIEEDGVPPLCIIADHFLAWTVDTARKYGIFHSIFTTSGAYGISVYFSLWKNLPHKHTDSDVFTLPEFPDIYIHRSQLTAHLSIADGTDAWSVFLRGQAELCMKSDAMLANTVSEFEGLGLEMLQKFFMIPVWSVGPLLRIPISNNLETNLLKWLVSQCSRSILYVSFGSQETISASQMMELAMALEESCRPFIWVVRPPLSFDINGKFRPEWLPEGYEERMRKTNKGIIVHGWAPQLEILSHLSVGAFLSHCGWNSVLESLTHGVPIIGWPVSGDQLYNSMFLEEVGVCVEVARGNLESSKVNEEEIQKGIEAVMGDEEMRGKAKNIGEMLKAALKEEDGENMGSSIKGLEEFFSSCCIKNSQNERRKILEDHRVENSRRQYEVTSK